MVSDKIQGGSFGGVDDLYREVILDHFKSPRNKGPLPKATHHADGMNPLCGDQISIDVLVEEGQIKDVKFDGHGCAISQSAASMMTAQIKGKKLSDVLTITNGFKQILGVQNDKDKSSSANSSVDLGDLEALEGVKKYPVRIKCALLSWNTLLESLKNQA